MGNYFIIHGSFGNPFGNWFRWLHDYPNYNGSVIKTLKYQAFYSLVLTIC